VAIQRSAGGTVPDPPTAPGASLARRCLAEALSTFVLVFAGCGAIVVDSERDGSLGPVGIAAAFGLAIMVMVYALAHVSGAHVNPAVSIAFAATRRFPARDALAYVPAQLAGAVLGALFLRVAWDGTPAQLGATTPTASTGAALAYELVLTGLLMFVILSVATDTRAASAVAAITIGGTVALGSLVGGDVSGASMNPARSFGPALVASEWTQFWIYVVGPIVGALAGALLYAVVRGRTHPGPR
jgi:aquaporin NIP